MVEAKENELKIIRGWKINGKRAKNNIKVVVDFSKKGATFLKRRITWNNENDL